MADLTDQEIQKALDEYFKSARKQYIGMRYVPIFGRKGEDTIEWDNTGSYEPLTVVLHEGNSYTSRQFVPVGIDIANGDYWAQTGNYNAQIEQYIQDIEPIKTDINTINTNLDTLNKIYSGNSMTDVGISPYSGSLNTFKKDVDSAVATGMKNIILVCYLSENNNSFSQLNESDLDDAISYIKTTDLNIWAVNFHPGNIDDLASYQATVEKGMNKVKGICNRAILFNETPKALDNVTNAINIVKSLQAKGYIVGISANYPVYTHENFDKIANAVNIIGINYYPWAGYYGDNLNIDEIKDNINSGIIESLISLYPNKIYINEFGVRKFYEYYNSAYSFDYDTGLLEHPEAQTMYVQAFLEQIGTKISNVFLWFNPADPIANRPYFNQLSGRK